MTTRSTYTAPRTLSTPSFRLPAPHARASLDVDAVRSPLLTPVEENTHTLGNDAPKTTWQKCRQSLAQFRAKNTGLMLVIASQAFYSAMNVFVKILNKLDPPVPPLELIFVRQIITYTCCTSYMVITKVPHPFIGPPGVRHLLVFRGFSGFFGLFGVYFSLQYLSLSDATVITFLAPTCTAIAGAVLLKEKLRIAELWAALVSLFGVILIARPAFIFGHSTASDGAEGGVTPAQRFAAVCVALFGVLGATGAYVSIRAIGHRAHAMHSLTSFSSTCVIAASLLSLLPSTPTLPTEWTIPSSREHVLLMFLIGALGFVAQALMTTGLQRETAGRGSMGMYAQIVFAGLYDALIFHTRMNALSMMGTMLIVGSALYVAVTKKATKTTASETAKIEAAEAGAATEEEGLLSAAEPTGGAGGSVPEPAIVSMGPVSREGTMRGAPDGLSDDQ